MPTPIVNNVLRSNNALPILNRVPGAAAAYSLRRLKSGVVQYPIKVRDDTNTELDIPFCGQDLCTGTLLSWLGRNQVASIPLGTDANADGLSDGWTYSIQSGITAEKSIEDNAQKLTITASTSINRVGLFSTTRIACAVGSNMTITGKIKTSGNCKGRFTFDWYNSSNAYISSTNGVLTAYADYTTVTLNGVAPANTASFSVVCGTNPNNIGDTGSAWFKDASVTISNQSAYVTTWYDQSGNGLNATQTTAGNQPRIVNAGAVDVDAGGKPTLVFDGSNDCFRITDNAALQLTTQLSINAVIKAGLSAGTGYAFARNGSSSAEVQYGLLWSNLTPTWEMYLNGGGKDTNTLASAGTQFVVTSLYNSEICEVFSNGASGGSNAYSTPLTNRTNIFIGCRSNAADGSAQSVFLNGDISEMIIFNSSIYNPQRQKLEKNQGKYFNLGVA